MQKNRPVWTDFANLFLGLWLIATSFTFVSTFRMGVNDLLCGSVVFVLSFLSLYRWNAWLSWTLCIVGIWLQFSPLLFWAREPFIYLNDTLTGIFIIIFSVMIPGERIEKKSTFASVPRGWSYNPSAWPQRIPISLLAFFSWMFARYMAAYQLGYIPYVWDPLFGKGTEEVITSWVSQMFPVSDAGLGALAYTIETLMALHGSDKRWHTMPWFVILFAIVVVPLGIASITLIILQPILVRFWCFWCLLTALCMLFMVTLAIDEAACVIDYLLQQKKKGTPLWNLIWKGSEEIEELARISHKILDEDGQDVATDLPTMGREHCPSDKARPTEGEDGVTDYSDSPRVYEKYGFRGISIPWNLMLTTFLGGWLMFCSPLFDVSLFIADQEHMIGAFSMTISIIAMAEVIRAGRYLLILLGAWTLFDLWFVNGSALLNHLVVGVGLILLSIPKGLIKEKYGDFQYLIR